MPVTIKKKTVKEKTLKVESMDCKLIESAPFPQLIEKMEAFEHKFTGLDNMDIEDLLHQEVLKGFKPNMEWKGGRLTNKSHKWRVISALQKAIRRGDVKLARLTASVMFKDDPSYLMRRMAIIALEDVGIGNMVAVSYVMSFISNIAKMKKLGGYHLAAYLAELLALSPKSRLFCDIACISWLAPESQAEKDYYNSDYDLEATYEKFIDTTQHVRGRQLAGVALLGALHTKVDGVTKYCKHDKHLVRKGLDVLGLKEIYKYVVFKGGKAGCEGLHISMVVAYHGFKGYKGLKLRGYEVRPVEKLHNIPLVSYDTHTTDGKKAYGYYKKYCSPIKTFLSDNDIQDEMSFIGSGVFNVEGLIIDVLVSSNYTNKLTRLNETINADRFGITVKKLREFYQLLKDTNDKLNKARLKVIN